MPRERGESRIEYGSVTLEISWLTILTGYNWFIEAQDPDQGVAIDDVNASLLFLGKILKISPASATIACFRCFEKYFLIIEPVP